MQKNKLLTKELCEKWLENKNKNPTSLRKIKETGAIYKSLKSKCTKILNKNSKNICEIWLNNKNINPETLRKIKETGTIYKNLLKKCSLNKNNAANKIQKIFTPFIKRVSANIIDRINFFLIIRKYITSINKKHKNICMRLYKYDKTTNLPIYRLGNHIILDNQIGSKSAYGIVFLAHYEKDINNQNNLNKLNKFAIKIINYSINNEIEYNVLTELTKQVILFKCPHFPITYGLIKCDNKNIRSNYEIPILNKIKETEINKTKNYPKLINDNNSLYYQINELASGDFNKYRVYYRNNYEYLLNSIAQIYISIMFFHKYINAFHNDAHAGNFLYHKIKSDGYFHYNIYGKDYYLKNIGFLWVIWDFGLIQPFSNSKVINNDKFGKYKKSINICTDYIKPIAKILEHSYNFNPIVIKYLTYIIKILNKYSNTTNILSLSNLNKELLKVMCDNISTFTTIKPENIINKKPYII
jgi:hypothetical protein